MKILVNRKYRLEPKKERSGLLFIFGCIVVMFAINELFSKDEQDYLQGQGKIVALFFLLTVLRLVTYFNWGEHYKETVNFLFGAAKYDTYIGVSLLNVVLDLTILFCLFFLIDLERVSFVRITVAGIVYMVLIIGSFLFKRKKALLILVHLG